MYCIICEAYAGYLGHLFTTGKREEWCAVEPQRNHHILVDHCHQPPPGFSFQAAVVKPKRERRTYKRRAVQGDPPRDALAQVLINYTQQQMREAQVLAQPMLFEVSA
jgi:hypothetical protein